MKRVIASIFSVLIAAGALSAECKPLGQTPGATTFWKYYTVEFGSAPFPGEFSVCTGNKYFHELKGGAKMKSAVDRTRLRILRREGRPQDLMHELAHIYLDLRWRILPYSVSEPLVLAMAVPEKCRDENRLAADDLYAIWPRRHTLERCETVNLIKSILRAEENVRARLELK